MPSWCDNRVAIRGEPEEVMALVKLIEGDSPFDFERVIPLPPPEGPNANDEAIAAWGVKWNAQWVTRQGYGKTGRVRYRFKTPYGSAIVVLNEIARRFPNVEIDLTYEVEMMAGGAAWWRGGRMTHAEGEAVLWQQQLLNAARTT